VRWWWLCLVAFFLMSTAWAGALPANGTYDEKDHIVRAYAVASGQLTANRTVVDRRGDVKPAFSAPASLLPSNANVDCAWSPRPAKTASCQQWTTDRHAILTPSGAARYSPVYYLVVGLPLLLAPDLTGIVLARLVSALLSALLLACAVSAALRLGSRLLVVGIVLTATPMAMNLNGSVNPNGLEISAGVLVFCALLALLRAPEDRLGERSIRRLLILVGVGSLLLLTVRQIGPVLCALDVVACALLSRPGRLAALWRRCDSRWILGGCWLAGAAFAAGWLAYSGLSDVAPNTRDAQHLTVTRELGLILTWRVPFYVKQVVGQFGYGETHLSPYALAAWYLLLLALVVPGLALAGRRFRVVPLGLGLFGIGVLVALEVHFVPTVGWFAQGRYAMPALVGVVLCATVDGGFERRLVDRGRLRAYAVALTIAAGALHLYALARVMTRFQVGIDAPLDPLGGSWRPPMGSLPTLLAALAAAALFVVLVAHGQVASPPSAEPPHVDDPHRLWEPPEHQSRSTQRPGELRKSRLRQRAG
jgi:hypothetical protein